MANLPTITPNPTVDKQSVVQRRSFGSVRVAFLNRERAIAQLSERAQTLVSRDSRVLAVGLFGSLARGEALPGSDADLLIVLRSHPQPRWFDRIAEYGAVFEDVALPVEPFPYTLIELTSMVSRPGVLRSAVSEAIVLAGDKTCLERLAHPHS